MSIAKKRWVVLVAVMVLVALMASITVLSIGKGVEAQAASEPVWEDEVTIAHVTDTHYYPRRLLYKGSDQKRLKEQMLVRQSTAEAVFMSVLEKVKETNPDYLVLTGDNSNDGERASMVDIANMLRNLQNEIRVTKPGFQIFVVQGNHDISNYDPYNRNTGESIPGATRKEISKIYASLGYPDITDEEAESFYTEEEFLGTGGAPIGFVNSTTAADVSIKWMFDETKDDYDKGELTFIAETPKNMSILGLDVPHSNVVEGHVLGGQVSNEMKDFLIANKPDSEYFVALSHHSVVEHMAYQEAYITGFLVDNWRLQADFLADFGTRYVFTGHVHCSAISHHMSFNNNQITDIQTTAPLEHAGMVRKATIKTGQKGADRVQNLYVQNFMIEEVDATKLFDEGYFTNALIEECGFKDLMNGKIIKDFQSMTEIQFIEGTIKSRVYGYLRPAIINSLKDMLSGLFSGSDNTILKSINPAVMISFIDILISEIETKILKDYEYTGDDPELMDSKLFAFANDLVDRAFVLEVTEGLPLLEFVEFLYNTYADGTEPKTADGLPEEIKKGLANIRSGEFVKKLVDFLLDEDKGLMLLLRGLLETPLDFSSDPAVEGLLEGLLLPLISKEGTTPDASNVVLGKVAVDALTSALVTEVLGLDLGIEIVGDNIMDFADDILDKYLTKSLYTGIGEMVATVATAFVTDESFDGDTTKKLIVFAESDEYTYTSIPREDIPTIVNGKLPSKLTVTFGSDTTTTKNFSWITDYRVTSGTIQYMEKSKGAFDKNEASSSYATTRIYGTTKGLIDAGLYAQLGYTEVARHTVELTGLEPNTEYLYRVGWTDRNYWSDVYTFKTAPEAGTPFEVLLITDPQSFTPEAYARIGNLLKAAEGKFENGYDFVVNCGDLVEYSPNTKMFGHFLDTLRGFVANTTQVVAAGNHEDKYFEMDEDYVKWNEEAYTEEYNYMLMHFNFDMPVQDSRTGAYYSYDYSSVHFVVLNSNDIVEQGLSQAQIDWLVDDLSTTDKKHKVVFMHKTLYSAGSHVEDKDIVAMRSQLPPIFEEYGVNLVISGHDHTYSESFYIDKDGSKVGSTLAGGKIADKGTIYINLGTVGEKYYKYREYDDMPIDFGASIHDQYLKHSTFGKLTFDGTDLYYEGFMYDAENDKVIPVRGGSVGPVETAVALALSVVVTGGIAYALAAISKARRAKLK